MKYLSVYGQDILRGISKCTFVISHKISYPCIEKVLFSCTTSKFWELLDLQAYKRFSNAPQIIMMPHIFLTVSADII